MTHTYYVGSKPVATVQPGQSHSRAWHLAMTAKVKA